VASSAALLLLASSISPLAWSGLRSNSVLFFERRKREEIHLAFSLARQGQDSARKAEPCFASRLGAGTDGITWPRGRSRWCKSHMGWSPRPLHRPARSAGMMTAQHPLRPPPPLPPPYRQHRLRASSMSTGQSISGVTSGPVEG